MRSTPLRIAFTLTSVVVAACDNSSAQTAPAEPGFTVTITNITQSQIFSPPVVATHCAGSGIFTAGAPASAELRMLAEDGLPEPLAGLLESDPDVLSVAVAPGPVMPGESVTLQVQADPGSDLLSAAGMLVTTNDGFFGLDSLAISASLPANGAMILVPAYDAGTEANNEVCGFIPGPPCGNPGVADESGVEGFISVHPGIHGIADLDTETWDWRNPVAKITVIPQ